MPQLKLYLDEHISPRLAVQLNKYGFNVTSTLNAGMEKSEDDEQLAYAVTSQRAIVTFNHRDFAVLHARYLEEGNEHWGIILSTEESVVVLRRRLLRLLNTLSSGDLRNQIRWLNEFR
jgi:predicted nuclease of predicted toxin-antitoxin system